MKKTLLLGLVAFGATAFASSNTFKMTLTQETVVEGKTLKPGDYKVTVDNGTAAIKQGKEIVEVPAREESATSKFNATSLLYVNDNNLSEIRFGGTRTSIVFQGDAPAQSGQ